MTFEALRTTRLLSLLAVVAFFGATEGQAYGLRPCPVHDAYPDAPHAQTDAKTAPGTAHGGSHVDHSDAGRGLGVAGPAHGEDPRASAGDHHPHPGGGPCTCIDDCHVGSSSPGPVASPAVVAAGALPPVVLGPMADGGSLKGPRHRLFELHLPNAPPL